jgi:hypothetical protein
MSRVHKICLLAILAVALSGAWAQDSTEPQSTEGAPQSAPQEPTPAYGQENAPPPITENPPLSGLDTPSLEPHAAPLSYLQPGATVSESADSNIGNLPGQSAVRSITRGLGSLTLQRLWSHYDLGLDYVGGAGYYNVRNLGWETLQQADIDQKITWKRGQLSLRDSFSYLPEGNFGGAYGSVGSAGIQSLGTSTYSAFFGGNLLGTLGLAPRIVNLSLGDIEEYLTPKSAVTATGGYAFTHFYGNDVETGNSFLGSSEVSAQVGYSHLLTPQTQVALLYGYQAFNFTVFGSAFHSHLVMGMYGHRITGRMDLLIAAGPQFSDIELPCTLANVILSNPNCHANAQLQVSGSIPNTRIGAAGQARLRYRFSRSSLELLYERFVTGGSGIFAGAQTDLAHLDIQRPLSRVWNLTLDTGYGRNSRLQPLSNQQLTSCGATGQPACPGIDANTYIYGFAGAALHRQFGHNWHAFASYQFNELSFDHSYCGGLEVCDRISHRHIGTVGLDWTPRPIRID